MPDGLGEVGLCDEVPTVRELVGMRTGVAGRDQQQHVRPAPADLLGQRHAIRRSRHVHVREQHLDLIGASLQYLEGSDFLKL